MNTKVVEDAPVRDHVPNMIGLLNELEVFRFWGMKLTTTLKLR